METRRGVGSEKLRCARAILAYARGDYSTAYSRWDISYVGWRPWVENTLVSFFANATSTFLDKKDGAFLTGLSAESIVRALVCVNDNVELCARITQRLGEILYVDRSRKSYGDMVDLLAIGLFFARFEERDPHLDITERAMTAFTAEHIGLSLDDISEEIDKALSRLVTHG
jgi:hypothetical protein